MRKKSVLIILLVVILAAIIVAAIFLGKPPGAPAAASWHRTFGGTADEAGLAVRQAADGGFVIAGVTTSFGSGGSDIWLIRTDSEGHNLWDKQYGGEGEESALGLLVLPDGYLIAGYTNSFGVGGQDALLLRTDENGEIIWNKTYGGAGEDAASAVFQAADGGFVVAGFNLSSGSGSSDGWLFKVDSSGSELWGWTYGGTEFDYLRSVSGTVDGGYILLGGTDSFGREGDVWLVKTDAAGVIQWQKTFRGQGEDFGIHAAQVEGGYLIAGTGLSSLGDSDFWLIKTDVNGATLWSRSHGGEGDDVLEAAQPTADGGILLVGRTYSFGTNLDIWLMKIDSAGNKVWEEVVGGDKDDTGLSVLEAEDGYVIAGETASYGIGSADVWLVKVVP